MDPRPRNGGASLRSAASAVLALALTAACGHAPRETEHPNVVLVVVDTLRADRLSCYGYPRPTSPWLDALADEGALFEDATAQAGWTLPSMVSLFTSRYLTAYSESIPPDVPSVAELFRAAGYRTVGVVGNLSVNERAGFARGFDRYDLRAAPPQPGDTGDRPRTAPELAEHLGEALDATEDDGRPLFLFLFPYDPHDPYYKHPELDDELPPLEWRDEELLAWQRARLADHPAEPPAVDPDWEKHLAQIQKQRAFYDQEVRFTDDVLAGVFEELRSRGVLEDAVVAFVADHGEGLWEHEALKPAEDLATATPIELFYQKHGAHLFEEAIATPFVLWGAGVPPGVRVRGAVENVDLVPTLLELAGVPAPPGLHGRSLVPLLRDPDAPGHAAVFAFLYHQLAVREVATGLKLIRPTGVETRVPPEPRLHDLPSDPAERENLHAARPEDVARLEGLLRAWLEGHPMESSFDPEADAAQLEVLRALGYTEEDIGR